MGGSTGRSSPSSRPDSSTGTGTIDAFVRLQAGSDESRGTVERGYNTDAKKVEFDEKTGSWTHSIQLSSIPACVRPLSGLVMREFFLDVNETKGESLLDLVNLRVYIADTPDLLYDQLTDPAEATPHLRHEPRRRGQPRPDRLQPELRQRRRRRAALHPQRRRSAATRRSGSTSTRSSRTRTTASRNGPSADVPFNPPTSDAPEPATLVLFTTAAVALLSRRHRPGNRTGQQE